MDKLFVVIVLAIIGAFFFDGVGALVGFVIGIWVSIAMSKRDSETALTVSSHPTPVTDDDKTFRLPVNTVERTSPPPSKPMRLSAGQLQEYEGCIIRLYATILSHYTAGGSSKVNEVTEFIQSDDWIEDKFKALEVVAERLTQFQIDRQNSPMLFQLHANALVERVLQLPKQMQVRIATQMDSLVDGFSDYDPKDCRDYIARLRSGLRRQSPVSKVRIDAEEYISRSGDTDAMSTLVQMRRNPTRYKELLKGGATGNPVLKTALGVFAGIIAADAVKAAVADYQIQNLLTQVDSAIDQAGGLETLTLVDKELDSLATADSVEYQAAEAGGESSSDQDLPDLDSQLFDEDRSDSIENEDGTDLYLNSDESVDLEVDDSDTDDGVAFDIDD